jgi:hypothetical protein
MINRKNVRSSNSQQSPNGKIVNKIIQHKVINWHWSISQSCKIPRNEAKQHSKNWYMHRLQLGVQYPTSCGRSGGWNLSLDEIGNSSYQTEKMTTRWKNTWTQNIILCSIIIPRLIQDILGLMTPKPHFLADTTLKI